MKTLTTSLKALVDKGDLRFDPAQQQLAERLDHLLQNLNDYHPRRSLLGRKQPPPQGLYIYGDVGRGKSMLMDMFYARLNTNQKQRIHYHAFMQDVHHRINQWRTLSARERRRQNAYVRGAGDNPLPPIAKTIANQAHILCFDEFHVTDIADAMILSGLFSQLFARGVVVVMTSNRAPDTLYQDGLNRASFLPFITLIKQKMEIFTLDGDIDHRLRKLSLSSLYYTPLGKKTDKEMDKLWARLEGPEGTHPVKLEVGGRLVELLASGGTARASFAELCQTAKGAADYLAIARTFSTLFLENVPVMNTENESAARRFITLIDTLYEAKTNLVISAAAEPENLWVGDQSVFEFSRTVSRLMEMRSDEYLGAEHALLSAH